MLTFANAAARAAFVIDPVKDVGFGNGKMWMQLDTGVVYRPIRGGAAAENWEEMYIGQTTKKTIQLSLNDFREVDTSTDVSNIAANGGLLASDTTPILRADAAESWEISWAAGNADIIAAHIALPVDFNGARDVTVRATVSSGSTDAFSATIETGWDGGTLVVDAFDDSATKSATKHEISATILAADIPDAARTLTIIITPSAHATNAAQLHNIALDYFTTAQGTA